MTPDNQYYDIPVYDFHGDNGIEVQTTTNDADEYVLVTYDERQFGDPDLRVVHVRTNQRDSYRFRITDEDRRWCAYRDGSPDEIPTHIQHAVTAYGYGISDLVEVDKYLFECMAAYAIHSQFCVGLGNNELPPIVNRLLDFTSSGVYELGVMLLAQFALTDDGYCEAFGGINHSTSDDFFENISPLIECLRNEIAATDAAALLNSFDQLKGLLEGVGFSTVSTGNGEYVLLDLVYEWGSYRFPFRKTNPDRCVYEGPNDVIVPPEAVMYLKYHGVELANRRLILDLPSEVELGLDKDDMTVMLADALADYIWLCDQVDASAILPEELARSDGNPLLDVATSAAAVESILCFAETKPRTFDKVYRDIAIHCDLPDVDELEHDELRIVAEEFIQRFPPDIQQLFRDRIDEISPAE